MQEELKWGFKRGREVKGPLISRERWNKVTSVPLPPHCYESVSAVCVSTELCHTLKGPVVCTHAQSTFVQRHPGFGDSSGIIKVNECRWWCHDRRVNKAGV